MEGEGLVGITRVDNAEEAKEWLELYKSYLRKNWGESHTDNEELTRKAIMATINNIRSNFPEHLERVEELFDNIRYPNYYKLEV